MRIQNVRSVAGIVGVGVAIVLTMASVAAACVPGDAVDTTSFTVRNGPGAGSDFPDSLETGLPVTSAKAGDVLWAVGRNLQLPDWPYQIKLATEPFATATMERCGEGAPQAVATTTGVGFGLRPSNFDVPFVFDPAHIPVGAAHFCALAAFNKAGADALPTIVQKLYVYDPGFTFTIV